MSFLLQLRLDSRCHLRASVGSAGHSRELLSWASSLLKRKTHLSPEGRDRVCLAFSHKICTWVLGRIHYSQLLQCIHSSVNLLGTSVLPVAAENHAEREGGRFMHKSWQKNVWYVLSTRCFNPQTHLNQNPFFVKFSSNIRCRKSSVSKTLKPGRSGANVRFPHVLMF